MIQLNGILKTLKDKFKFYYGKIDEDRFIIMLSIFLNRYNFHFSFIPSNWKEWYYQKEGKKFIDNDIRYCINLGIFQFIFHDFTGIDYIHIIVDEDYNYYAPQQEKNIKKFIIALYNLAENYDTFSCIPCRFRSSVKPNGHLIFYATINREWLIENNLGALTTILFPDCYLNEEEIDYYFPSYGKYDHHMSGFEEFIPYIRIEKFEGEA